MNVITFTIKRLGLSVLIFLLSCAHLFAQPTSIRGKILDTRGQPLPGASVAVKGSSVRTLSDNDGNFEISKSTGFEPGDVIVVSYIGFVTLETTFSGSTSLTITLEEDPRILGEVVVTALGIKREEKSLGYAAQNISEGAVKDARTNNWVNSLAGKVSGLNIQGTGAGPMGSSRITLRGESSLNLDNNQALIILDGVPVSSKITGTGFNSHLAADSPVDYGSALSDINPDDIEKVTVLKGAGATALTEAALPVAQSSSPPKVVQTATRDWD